MPSEYKEVEDETVESNEAKRRRLSEEIILKKGKDDDERTDTILFYYLQYTYYVKPPSPSSLSTLDSRIEPKTHSMPTAVPEAVPLRLWSIKGEQRLKELLVEMGLLLAQSKQQLSAMDLYLRHEFKEKTEKLAGKYNIDNIIGASFTLQYSYKKYCSSDIVYAMLASLLNQRHFSN